MALFFPCLCLLPYPVSSVLTGRNPGRAESLLYAPVTIEFLPMFSLRLARNWVSLGQPIPPSCGALAVHTGTGRSRAGGLSQLHEGLLIRAQAGCRALGGGGRSGWLIEAKAWNAPSKIWTSASCRVVVWALTNQQGVTSFVAILTAAISRVSGNNRFGPVAARS
jgi:hypothetical protein